MTAMTADLAMTADGAMTADSDLTAVKARKFILLYKAAVTWSKWKEKRFLKFPRFTFLRKSNIPFLPPIDCQVKCWTERKLANGRRTQRVLTLTCSQVVCCTAVIRFLWISAKFVTCKVKRTLVEAKIVHINSWMYCTHFIFNTCLIYTHYGASAKLSTNSHDTNYSVAVGMRCMSCTNVGKRRMNFYRIFPGIRTVDQVAQSQSLLVLCMNWRRTGEALFCVGSA